MVRANGDHTLGHYEAGHLHGVVREEEEGGLVTREITYISGQRHGAWREWRAGELACVAWDTGARWTRTRSVLGSDNKILHLHTLMASSLEPSLIFMLFKISQRRVIPCRECCP